MPVRTERGDLQKNALCRASGALGLYYALRYSREVNGYICAVSHLIHLSTLTAFLSTIVFVGVIAQFRRTGGRATVTTCFVTAKSSCKAMPATHFHPQMLQVCSRSGNC